MPDEKKDAPKNEKQAEAIRVVAGDLKEIADAMHDAGTKARTLGHVAALEAVAEELHPTPKPEPKDEKKDEAPSSSR